MEVIWKSIVKTLIEIEVRKDGRKCGDKKEKKN